MPQIPIVFATTTSHVATKKGVHVLVREGQAWPADDEIVQSYPTLFTDQIEPYLTATGPVRSSSGQIEQATRNPGERRVVRRHESHES